METPEDPLDTLIEVWLREREGLDPGQRADVVRQILRGRHLGAVDQHWQDAGLRLQRSGDLLTEFVLRVCEPSATLCITPPHADDGDKELGDLHPLRDHRLPLSAFLDGVFVEEDAIVSEFGAQTLSDPSGVARGVVPAIADEDVAQGTKRAQTYPFNFTPPSTAPVSTPIPPSVSGSGRSRRGRTPRASPRSRSGSVWSEVL